VATKWLHPSELRASGQSLGIELQKFEYLDLFCIINKEDITESYPIADINPRTWKQAIASSPKSSIITSIENMFIVTMDNENTWNLHNIVVPPTGELEDLNINLQIPSTELRADQLTSFICLAKKPNTNSSLNSWLGICENFENANGDSCSITFP